MLLFLTTNMAGVMSHARGTGYKPLRKRFWDCLSGQELLLIGL